MASSTKNVIPGENSIAKEDQSAEPFGDRGETMEASAKRARALFEGIEDSVFVHDLHGKILDANPAASRRLGYSREEFLALNTREIDDPEFANGYEDRLKEQLRKGNLHCEGRHRTKDGRIIPVDINTSTIILEDRPVVLAVIRDISERKALEKAKAEMAETLAEHARQIEEKNRELSQSEARYRLLTEGSLDAVIVTDDAAKVVLFNHSAEKTFGYDSVEVVGQPLARLMPDDLPNDPILNLTDAIKNRNSKVIGQTMTMNGRRKDGESFPLEISISAVETSDGIQFLNTIRDHSDKRKMEAMLAQSEKLASIGLLSAGVAHEINNPLSFIGNNLAVLQRDLKGVYAIISAYEEADGLIAKNLSGVKSRIDEAKESLDWNYVRENLDRMLSRTREGVGRVASIVQTMRGLARTAPPVMEQVSLSDLISAALELVQGRIRRGDIEIRRNQPEPKPPMVSCVSTQISQVLINLLVNAIQAIEESKNHRGKFIEVSLRREHGFQVISVEDSGDGISPEALPKLFDPFFTTKPVGEGTGLGLSISHGIVTGHGGRLEVHSAAGRGARFEVWLPEAKR